jgi:hypothetical protein
LADFVGEETAQSIVSSSLALSIVDFVKESISKKDSDFVTEAGKSADLVELRCEITSKDPKTNKLTVEEDVSGAEAGLDIYNAINCDGQEIQVMGNCIILLAPWTSVSK